ncbi:heterokaryon incompatibility protein-domain-containing protein, partial [Phaeosphaeria sp. MPI-PUGE-AT-0046c]
RYEALDTDTRSFRLLEILPDMETTPVRLRLSPSTFDDDCPTYSALSYSWQYNPPQPQMQIYCNDLPMRIGYNLWTFLRQCRKTDGTGHHLWVDAICIDQQNISERNHQVAQMRDIYSKAARAIVWLGPDIGTDEATEAFDLVTGPNRLLYRDSRRDMRWHRSRRQWRALEKLLNRSYWSRVWIIQEFILAKLVELRCGNRIAPLENFDDICRWLETLEKPFTSRHLGSAGITFSRAYRLFKHRTEWWNTNGSAQTFSLRRLFEAYATSKSSDRRDKVYGLLGLACTISNQRSLVYADYSKKPVEILIDVVRNQCGWATRKDELANLHLVLLLKKALSVEHDEVHTHVLYYAPDLYPFLHLLSTTEFVRTNLLCIATVMEVG